MDPPCKEAPVRRLPPELLALVFEHLESPERIPCLVVCHYWRALIKTLWPQIKPNLNNLFVWAARIGSQPLMKFAKKWGAIKFIRHTKGATKTWIRRANKPHTRILTEALVNAASEGQIDCLNLLKNWGATGVDIAFKYAARGGHTSCLKLLKYWGATCFDDALYMAAYNNHVDCLRLLNEWGATSYDQTLFLLKDRGNKAITLLRKWKAEAQK